jgi:hypothetical protein
LNVEEPRLIEELKPEYNATLGGEGTLGYKHTENTKKIISRFIYAGRKESEEHKKWRSEKSKGWMEKCQTTR